MLKFFKDLFKKEEEILEVNFLELNSWLDQNFYHKVEHATSRIADIRKRLYLTTEKLEHTHVNQAKVEEKLKTVVEGNKTSFVKALHSLLLKLETPDKLEQKTLTRYAEDCGKELEAFHGRTARNFYIMKQLIGEEADAVTANLKELHMVVVSLKALAVKSKLAEDIRSKLAEIQDHLDEKGQRKRRIRELEEQRNLFLEKERQLKERIEKLKQSKHFYDFEKFTIQKNELLKKELSLINEVDNLFSPVKKALKKSAFAKEKMVEHYLERTSDALLSDKNLKILDVLQKLQDAVKKGSIEVKQKEKAIDAIHELGKLKELQEGIRKVQEGLQEANGRLKKNSFLKVEDKFVRELQELESYLGKVNEELDAFLSFELKTDIKYLNKLVSQLAGREVIVKHAPVD